MQVLHLGALTSPPPLAEALAVPTPSGAVAIGNFDGVHRGHQALIAAGVEEARRRQKPCVALTFDPHPAQVLAPERAPRRIMTEAQKREHLEALGVQVLAVLPFTPQVAAESPESFARRLLAGRLGAQAVVVGEGFRFGVGRQGDVPLLRQIGARLGFTVVAVAPVLEGGAPVSSTRIREALAEGDLETARALLGRPPFADGVVVPGEARGRTLGFPTANLATENEILPRAGVYAARVRLEAAGEQKAVVNLGRRPTFGGGDPTLEAHLLDWSGELYGQRLRVFFMARLRDERRFDGVSDLKAQIRADVERARLLLGSQGIVRHQP